MYYTNIKNYEQLTTHYLYRLFAMIFFAFMTASCSGGGGGNSVTDPVTNSATNPATDPVSNDTTTFSVGGTVTRLSSSGLVLQNNSGDNLPVAGVTFEFATVIADGADYDVTILTQPTGQSCDIAGGNGTVNGANVSDVTVTCHGWGEAELIERDVSSVRAPRIAVDAAGNALAVWQQDGSLPSDGSIMTNLYTAGSGWGVPEVIHNGDNAAVPSDIAIDAAGNAIVVWHQVGINKTGENTWANRYSVNSGWGAAELIKNNNADEVRIYGLKIALDTAGNALTVWSQQDFHGGQSNLWSNRYTAGVGWGTSEVIDTDVIFGTIPSIATDATGNAIAIWQKEDGSQSSIRANLYTADIGWGAAEFIETDNIGAATSPQIAFDSTGSALAVWQQSDGTRTNVWSSRYTTPPPRCARCVGWGTPELIETNNIGDAFNQQIATDATGNAIAVWQQEAGRIRNGVHIITGVNILANRYTAGVGWGNAELIETSNNLRNNRPDVTMDDSGNAIAVWTQGDGFSNNKDLFANRYTAGIGWGTAELIETSNNIISNLDVTMNATGNAIAVWEQGDNILANQYE